MSVCRICYVLLLHDTGEVSCEDPTLSCGGQSRRHWDERKELEKRGGVR